MSPVDSRQDRSAFSKAESRPSLVRKKVIVRTFVRLVAREHQTFARQQLAALAAEKWP